MTAYRYAIVRLVPDTLREEFINVGIILAPVDGPPVVRMMGSAEARESSLKTVSSAKDLLESVRDNVQAWGADGLSALQDSAAEWAGSVQLSPVRATRADGEPRLICELLYEQYVGRERAVPTMADVGRRSRATVRRLVVNRLENVIPKQLVHRNPQIPGELEAHKFDASVQNGKLLHAVTTLSFEIKTMGTIKSELEAAAYAMYDVRQASPDLALSLVTVGDSHPKMLARAHNICSNLDVAVVREPALGDWLQRVQSEVRPHLEQPRLDD
jgi:hypothetical protein